MSKSPIYLDYNASTPLDPKVAQAMRPYGEKYFGNPSSSHWHGAQAKKAVDQAREQVSALLGCDPCEIVFTSGGTESNNHAIKGAAFASKNKGNHIITSQIEHPAVLEVCRFLEQNGFEVTYLPVDTMGFVDVSEVKKAIKGQTILITIMQANNEVGTVQSIPEIARLAKERNILMHTDAAQSVGKLDTHINRLGVDLLSIAGHKLYAPKGIGALYIRKGITLSCLIHGAAGHEQGRRAGTENVSGIVGLGKACEIARQDLTRNSSHMAQMRDSLFQGLTAIPLELKRHGHPTTCLPNTLSVGFKEVQAAQLLSEIRDGLSVSAGSACHGSGVEISHVLRAMKIPENWARGTLRFSTGRMTTKEEIRKAISVIKNGVLKITKSASRGQKKVS